MTQCAKIIVGSIAHFAIVFYQTLRMKRIV